MDWLFPFHPRLVHFPIALGIVGAVTLAWGVVRVRPRWTDFGRVTLFLAWIGVLVAAGTGLIDQSRAPDTPTVSNTINQHITAGVALIVILGLALYWPLRDRQVFASGNKRWAYVGVLVIALGLILLEAWLGGRLVYKLGVGVTNH